MQNANELESFRSDVRAWVTANFPASLQGADLAGIAGGESGARASDTVKAGMEAFLAGRIKKQNFAIASSPEKNISI